MRTLPTRRRKCNPQSPDLGKRRERAVPHPRRGSADARVSSNAQFALYDGRDRLGSFRRDGDCFIAFNRLGRPLGTFSTQAEACEAIEREAVAS